MMSGVVFFSCKKEFLQSSSQNGSVTDQTAFKDKASFDAYIFGAYTEMQGANQNSGALQWLLLPGFISQDILPGNERGVILSSYLTAGSADILSYWSVFYKLATRANLVLDKLAIAPPAVADADKTVIEGEAKFIRGFAYFNLARAFGNIPLILKSYEDAQKSADCTDENAVWDQVIQDLSDAAAKLPKRSDWGVANLGRATKGSALAYLANAYLYKKDWPNAVQASKDLIALNEYRLLDDVRDFFTLKVENTDESIFEIQYRDIDNSTFDWGGVNPNNGNYATEWTAPRGIGEQYAGFGGWSEAVMNKKLADSYAPDDDRRRKLVVAVGETYMGETMSSPVTIPASVIDHSAFTTKYWLGPTPYFGNGTNLPQMRYAEFLLNYAEALFKSGKQEEAYDQLNLVRERAKVTPRAVSASEDVFMTDLMQERRWELNFEPNLWFHYTRTERAAKFLLDEYGITFNSSWSKFPIPQSERDLNPKLCQNNGY